MARRKSPLTLQIEAALERERIQAGAGDISLYRVRKDVLATTPRSEFPPTEQLVEEALTYRVLKAAQRLKFHGRRSLLALEVGAKARWRHMPVQQEATVEAIAVLRGEQVGVLTNRQRDLEAIASFQRSAELQGEVLTVDEAMSRMLQQQQQQQPQ